MTTVSVLSVQPDLASTEVLITNDDGSTTVTSVNLAPPVVPNDVRAQIRQAATGALTAQQVTTAIQGAVYSVAPAVA